MSNPIDPRQAYDLDRLRPEPPVREDTEKVKETLADEQRKAEALAAEATEAELKQARAERVRTWDRSMTRAFKGIFPRPRRLAFMESERKRLERALEATEGGES